MDIKDYGPGTIRGYRYVLVVSDNFIKIGFKIPLKNKNAQSINVAFENILKSSKGKPNLIESDNGLEFVSKSFTDFLNKNNIRRYSRYTSVAAAFAERFNRTIRDLPKRPVFAKGDGNWIDILPTVKKQHNIRIHSSAKLTPIQASLKKHEGYVYNNLLDKREKVKRKAQVNDFIRVPDLGKTFSTGDKTNWSYKFYRITEIISDTISGYKTDNLKER